MYISENLLNRVRNNNKMKEAELANVIVWRTDGPTALLVFLAAKKSEPTCNLLVTNTIQSGFFML